MERRAALSSPGSMVITDWSPEENASRRRVRRKVGRAVRCDDPPVGKQFAGVLEQHHPVAEQTPSLLGVAGDGASGLTVGCARRGAWRLVRAHLRASGLDYS